MKNLTFITRFKKEVKARKEAASRKRLRAIAKKLGDRELFPERVARANELLRRLALTDKRFTVA
ncbi:hypothetical protein GO495_09735 [Chitinophaga oryziterrae]|uniref:Uncharacterized protein n=1 Tax=Chitinophaga oryziterrae TaxID=1031224 RepID=A0A6N8J8L8_9BACT|nr:hypothetical protein [Chitinophaga oryziterrae]MVT40858.1 hypothetical protein [Chitinophaga oryziterrae]